MHFYLEAIEKIIQTSQGMKCERVNGDTALRITDFLYDIVVDAEMVIPQSIRLAYRVTPPLLDVAAEDAVDIYEYFLTLTSQEATMMPFDPDTKTLAIGAKFKCGTMTDMAGKLDHCLAELSVFKTTHQTNIREYLLSKRIAFDQKVPK